MASSLLNVCAVRLLNLNCKLRSFLARDFIEGGQGLPWEPWLEGSCLHTEAQSQDCSEFASMNLASKSPFNQLSPPFLHLLPDPMASLGSSFSEAVVKILFPYRSQLKGKPYS